MSDSRPGSLKEGVGARICCCCWVLVSEEGSDSSSPVLEMKGRVFICCCCSCSLCWSWLPVCVLGSDWATPLPLNDQAGQLADSAFPRKPWRLGGGRPPRVWGRGGAGMPPLLGGESVGAGCC